MGREWCKRCGEAWPVGWGVDHCWKCLDEDILRRYLREIKMERDRRIDEVRKYYPYRPPSDGL